MRILGIDPALAGPTGFGVVETNGRACRPVDFGVLPGKRSAAHGATAARLGEIHAQITHLLDRHAPDALAIEGIFSALNVKTALKLAEVRGVVLLAAAQRGIPVHSYSPREVKLSISGYGHADKQQMQQMVRAQLQLSEPPRPADAADALAVALCHIHASRAQARLAAATSAGPVKRGTGAALHVIPLRSPIPARPRSPAGSGSSRHRAARIQLHR
jgi:crossover junction endodeoxyribonuclease RuvC